VVAGKGGRRGKWANKFTALTLGGESFSTASSTSVHKGTEG